jgi:predicted HicB family RNase H-like nuclease
MTCPHCQKEQRMSQGKMITIRVSAEFHERVKAAAKAEGKSMNEWCVEVLEHSMKQVQHVE